MLPCSLGAKGDTGNPGDRGPRGLIGMVLCTYHSSSYASTYVYTCGYFTDFNLS